MEVVTESDVGIDVHHNPSHAVALTFRIMIEKEVFNIGILISW